MDLASLIGVIGAMAVMVGAMVANNDIGIFINTPSLLIVVGGSLFAMLTRYGLGQFFSVLGTVKKTIFFSPPDAEVLMQVSVNLADVSRKEGFLGLQNVTIEDEFLSKGINMLIDGVEFEVIEQNLEQDIDLTMERHMMGVNFFKKLGDVAPAMGMIGTLIGLVSMLVNMDDPKTIGPAMSVALLTTMYGSMIANMISLPLADKLELRMNEVSLSRRMSVEAVLAIHSGVNPNVIEGYLKNYFNENKREELVTQSAV